MGETSTGPVTTTTRLPANGSTAISVTPPAPCGLEGCVAELRVTIGHDSMRLHLAETQRTGLIQALGGEIQ